MGRDEGNEREERRISFMGCFFLKESPSSLVFLRVFMIVNLNFFKLPQQSAITVMRKSI